MKIQKIVSFKSRKMVINGDHRVDDFIITWKEVQHKFTTEFANLRKNKCT